MLSSTRSSYRIGFANSGLPANPRKIGPPDRIYAPCRPAPTPRASVLGLKVAWARPYGPHWSLAAPRLPDTLGRALWRRLHTRRKDVSPVRVTHIRASMGASD